VVYEVIDDEESPEWDDIISPDHNIIDKSIDATDDIIIELDWYIGS
jgi:hypothetical protein